MKVVIIKLQRSETSDHHAVNVLKEGTAYGETALKGYVSSIRSLMDKNKESPKVITMKDGMSKQYWEKFGLFFEAQPAPYPVDNVTQLKLYDVYIGPSAMGSHRLVMLSESEESGAAELRWKFRELTAGVKVELTEIVGPFKSGFILCKVDNGGRQEFNGIYRDARD